MTYDDIWVWCTRPTKSGNVKLSSLVLPHPIAFRSTLAKHGKTVCCLCVFPGCRRHVLNRFPVLFSENPGKALQNFLYCRSSHMYFLPFSLLFPEHFFKKRFFSGKHVSFPPYFPNISNILPPQLPTPLGPVGGLAAVSRRVATTSAPRGRRAKPGDAEILMVCESGIHWILN